jgi:Asp-tRNA(Asn)/Glu-tRNA(Gln) amidotransferase A subunit family amidase
MALRTIAAVSELVRTGQISPLQLLRECLETIIELNPSLNAFITVTADSARAEARRAAEEIRSGKWRGPLHGIPVGLKDLIDTAGTRTTAASAQWENRIPARDAEVVGRLIAAGAIVVGKQNLHEFAYGGSSLISHFGPVHNPRNLECIAGGSSGGSAAAVAGGMCYGAIGTDTAGSVREPAALCGVVGFKPSYGLVSMEGIIPLSGSLDHAGPIARSVEDAAILLDVLAGHQGKYRGGLRRRCRNVRLGIPRTFFYEQLHAEVAAAAENAMQAMKSLGCFLLEVEIRPETDRTLQSAEAYAYHRGMVATSPELYHPETLRRIRSGENVTEEQHRSARRELERTREEITAVFRSLDLLIMPTTPTVAPRVSDLMSDLERLRPTELFLLRNTRSMNVWGLPAISIPCGSTRDGLPIGLQIVGPPHAEENVLAMAYACEQVLQNTAT